MVANLMVEYKLLADVMLSQFLRESVILQFFFNKII